MGTKNFEVDKNECNELAHKIFLDVSGINKEGRKFERMKKDAFQMRSAIEDRIKIRAAYAYFDDVKVNGQTALIGGVDFPCNAFEQIDPDAVEGAYVYALSVGDFSLPEDPIMNQLYADIWGTAFTDSVRLLMKKEIEKASRLSDSFGPGFYGMDVSNMGKMTELIDFEGLEMELRQSRILLPLKSCAGLYFSVNKRYQYLNRACENCRGSYSSCKLCQLQGGTN